MTGITTHVLDTARGLPATGVQVRLERAGDGATGADAWRPVGEGVTDADGRCGSLLPEGTPVAAGTWRLVFDTGAYFTANGIDGFYPWVTVAFTVADGRHHHVPLLLSPNGYTTYRGS